MVDEFIDRLRGRHLVKSEGAAARVNDMFFDSKGTKWLCVKEEREPGCFTLEFENIQPVTALKVLKRIVVVAVYVLGGVAITWFLQRIL